MASTRRKRQKFEVGDCVETSKGEKCIIRFIGKVEGLSHSILYGIEYIDGTMGEHNGKYKGKKYFIGLPKRCSFIKYNKIRRKTKYHYTKTKSKSSKRKANIASLTRPKSTRCVHSNDMFSRYRFKSNPYTSTKRSICFTNSIRTRSVSPSLSSSDRASKRKSLPTKLNKSNKRRKAKSAAINSNASRRVSESDKNKDKIAPLNISKLQSAKNKSKKRNKYKNDRRKKTYTNLDNKRCNTTNRNRSISIEATKECTLYEHERIRFSAMDVLQISDSDYAHMQHVQTRKNACSAIVLSADCMNLYADKVNVVIGEINIGHRYLLKDGHCGVCLFVGAVHWMNNGAFSMENEYIGIALDDAYGRHDGEWRGMRYFQCQPRCGIFVRRNKLYKDCGPVDAATIERITTKQKHKFGGLLYENESDLSDLSDLINNLSDSDDVHSGHSDIEFDLQLDDIDDEAVEEVLSYIDIFSPSIDAVDAQYVTHEDDEDITTPKDIITLKDIMTPKDIITPKHRITSKDIITPKHIITSKDKITPKACKTKKQKKKHKIRSRSVKSLITEFEKTPKTKKKKKKRKFRTNVCVDMKSDSIQCKKQQSQTPDVTKRNRKIEYPQKQRRFTDRNGINYEHVLSKKRSRRHVTPNVSIPMLIGQRNFDTLFNDDDVHRNDIHDLCRNLSSKSLTPLASDTI